MITDALWWLGVHAVPIGMASFVVSLAATYAWETRR